MKVLFANVDACLGGVMSSSYGTVWGKADGTMQLNNADESSKGTFQAPLIVHHQGSCSGAPTLHTPLKVYAEGGLDLGGVNVGDWLSHRTCGPLLVRAGAPASRDEHSS